MENFFGALILLWVELLICLVRSFEPVGPFEMVGSFDIVGPFEQVASFDMVGSFEPDG